MSRPKEKDWAALAQGAADADAKYAKAVQAAADAKKKATEEYSKARTHLLLVLGGMVVARAKKDSLFRGRMLEMVKEEEIETTGERAKKDRANLAQLIEATGASKTEDAKE